MADIGFHCQHLNRDVIDAIAKTKPPLIKTMAWDYDTLGMIRDILPETTFIGRLFVFPQHYHNPKEDARKFVSLLRRERAYQDGFMNFVESYNELIPGHAADNEHRLYDEFQCEFARLIKEDGVSKPIAMNFASGNGDGPQWLKLYKGTLDEYEYIGAHEYDFFRWDRTHKIGLADKRAGEDQKRFPGGPQSGNGGAWTILRNWRINAYLNEAGYDHKWFITECGFTQGVYGGDDKGHRETHLSCDPNAWGGETMSAPVSDQQYAEGIYWYKDQLDKLPWVEGFCLYQTGAAGDWQSFEHIPGVTDILHNHYGDFNQVKPAEIKVTKPIKVHAPTQKEVTVKTTKSTVSTDFYSEDFDLDTYKDRAIAAADIIRDVDQANRLGQMKATARWLINSNRGANHEIGNLVMGLIAFYEDVVQVEDAGPVENLLKANDPPKVDPIISPPKPKFTSHPHRLRVGVHGRNDENWPDVDFRALREMKAESVKVMSHTKIEVLDRLKREIPGIDIISRLYDPRINYNNRISPPDFVSKAAHYIRQAQPYCQKFQILNEVNHQGRFEGWSPSLDDARDFNLWYLDVLQRLRQQFRGVEFIFPGLALHHGSPPDFEYGWLEACRQSIEESDALGCHAYWQQGNHMSDFWGLVFKSYHERFPGKPIDLLECGASDGQGSPHISQQDRANQYFQWLGEVEKYGYVRSTAFFILSSPDPTWSNEGFTMIKNSGEFLEPIRAIANFQSQRQG